jgi:hypothetical protein
MKLFQVFSFNANPLQCHCTFKNVEAETIFKPTFKNSKKKEKEKSKRV